MLIEDFGSKEVTKDWERHLKLSLKHLEIVVHPEEESKWLWKDKEEKADYFWVMLIEEFGFKEDSEEGVSIGLWRGKVMELSLLRDCLEKKDCF